MQLLSLGNGKILLLRSNLNFVVGKEEVKREVLCRHFRDTPILTRYLLVIVSKGKKTSEITEL